MLKNIVPWLTAFFLTAALAAPCLAQSVPAIPNAYRGTVTINGSPAPAGTRIECRGTGVLTGVSGNPITITQAGLFGDEAGLSPMLIVQGNIAEGAALSFFVDDNLSPQTATWHSGAITRLDLAVLISDSGGGSEGNPPVAAPLPVPEPTPSPEIPKKITGTAQVTVPTDDAGIIASEIVLISEDQVSTVTISSGTVALDSAGTPLNAITCNPPAALPPPAYGLNVLAAYDLGPEGSAFTPPITISMKFDPSVDMTGLTLAFYDANTGDWVSLDNLQIDSVNHIISGTTTHFSLFAVLYTGLGAEAAAPALIYEPAVTAAVSETVSNLAQAPSTIDITTPSPTPSTASGSKPGPPVNGVLLAVIAAAASVIGIGVWWIVRKDRKRQFR